MREGAFSHLVTPVNSDFARRVYQVSYRIYDYYGLPPAVLVLYTDKRRKYHYREFSYSFFSTELEYRFPTFALIDYQVEELDRDGNIFGLALQAACEELSLQGKGLDLQRLEVKLRLLRRLLGMKVPKDNIRVLAINRSSRLEKGYADRRDCRIDRDD